MEEVGLDGSILKLGKKINEGNTKQIFEIVDSKSEVLLLSKDAITANNAEMKDEMQAKAVLATSTTCAVFQLLQKSGFGTAYVRQHSARSFVSRKCQMLPIEWVTRRLATGSFLQRNPGVPEGHLFFPPRIETFYKDDAKGNPEISAEQVVHCALAPDSSVASRQVEHDVMRRTTQAVFEVLERAWAQLDCTLVDMKIEFGVDSETGELLVADVIDNDSWRLWPQGDRSQMKGRQVYHELPAVTPETLHQVMAGHKWAAEKVQLLLRESTSRVMVVMGSTGDRDHCAKIQRHCRALGLSCITCVCSVYTATADALRLIAEFEGAGGPCVVIVGSSTDLGAVLAGNSCCPVINCPPLSESGAQDAVSALRRASVLGCSTVLSPEAAALAAAAVFSGTEAAVWSRLRVRRLATELELLHVSAAFSAQ